MAPGKHEAMLKPMAIDQSLEYVRHELNSTKKNSQEDSNNMVFVKHIFELLETEASRIASLRTTRPTLHYELSFRLGFVFHTPAALGLRTPRGRPQPCRAVSSKGSAIT